jgi:hypothetical protein
MSAKNISLVLLGVILLGSLVWLLVTGFRRKDPVAMEGKSHFWTRSWNYVFGTRKAQKFESPEEAFYFSPHRWLLDVFFALILLFVLIFMNLDLDLGSKFQSVPKWSDIGDILGKLFQIDWDYFFGIGIDAMGVPYTFEVSVLYQIFQTFGIAFTALRKKIV